MEQLIEFLTDNPLYALGIVVLALLLVFALFKKMMKIALLAVVLMAAYIYYLQDSADKAYARAQDRAERVIDKAGDLFDDAKELTK